MESDIVQRLREMAGPIRPNICTDAADEIERLRAGGCARDQKTTQYCAEAVRLQTEIERMRGELVSTTNRLTEERDEARRLYCRYLGSDYATVAKRIAAERGWDCFKEASK